MIRHYYRKAKLFILTARQEEAECELRRAALLKQDAERLERMSINRITSLAIRRAQMQRCEQAKVLA